jgi:hypothetical protein
MSKKSYGGESSKDRSEDWSKQLFNIDSPVQPVPSQELDTFRQDFLHAAQRARLRLRQQQPRHKGLLLRIAFSSIAFFAVMAIGLCMLMTPSVEAFSLTSLHGQVFSAADGLPIPNVKVRNLISGTIACSTDTWGQFNVDAPPNAAARYALEYDQHKITERYVGTGDNCTSGYNRFDVALQNFRRREAYAVKVTAGQPAEAGQIMHVGLQPGSIQTWTGQAIQQHDWPQVFNYGRVVDGIFLLQGHASQGLILSVAVSAERLRSMEGKAEDLRVIAYDARFANDVGLLQPDGKPYKYQVTAFHRGWFRLDKPLAGYLPQAEPTITTQDNGGTVIAWPAEVGRQYALILPVTPQGKVTACYVKSEEDPSAHYSKELLVLDQRRPMMGVYDVEYINGAQSIPVLNIQPLHSHLRYSFESDFVSRDGTSHPAFAKPDEPADIPGEFTVHLFDFTLTDSIAYTPAKAVFPKHGKYSIKVDQAIVGAESHIRVVGDLGRLAQPPRWDLGTDYRDDSFTDSFEMLVPAPAAYRVNVTLYEKNGAVVRLSRWVDVEAGNVVGFNSNEYGSIPIIRCTPEMPKLQSTYLAQTAECVVDPLPFGYCTGSSLGPSWLFTPPEAMRETPLKELHIVLYVKPLGGDISPASAPTQPAANQDKLAVYLSPSVGEVGPVSTWKNGTPAYSNPAFMAETGIAGDIALSEVSHQLWQLRSLIEKIKPGVQQPDIEAALTRELTGIGAGLSLDQDYCRLQGFKLGLDLDLMHLLDKHDTAQKVYRFYHSPYYSVRFASRNDVKIEWVINLHGAHISKNNSLLVQVPMETQGFLINAQYDLLSGGDTPASITLTPQDGPPYTAYLDYSAVTQSARQPVKQRQD